MLDNISGANETGTWKSSLFWSRMLKKNKKMIESKKCWKLPLSTDDDNDDDDSYLFKESLKVYSTPGKKTPTL